MGQYVFPDGTTAYVRNSTALNKLFGPDGKIYSAGGVYVTDSSGTDRQIATSTGLLHSNGVPINYVETITYSSGGASPSTITPYGVSYIAVAAGDPSTSPILATMSAPIPGVPKTIVFASTAAYVNTLDVALANATIVGTSGLNFIAFSSLAEQTQVVNLMGITTALWSVVSINSTVGEFSVATGIRGTTAARTS